MADITTTTSATGVSVTPPVHHTYDEWGVAGVIMSGVLGTIVFLGAVMALVNGISSFLKGRKVEEKEKDAPLEKRIQILENRSDTFKSSDYLDKEFARIENKVDHNKSNIQMCIDQITNMYRGLSSDVVENQRSIIRLNEQYKNMESNSARTETTLTKFIDRIEDRFDTIQTILSNVHKVNLDK